MKKVIALLLVTALAGCATWQDSVRKGLGSAAASSEQAIGASETICKQVLQTCIAARENPCAALDKCLAVRHGIIRAAVMTQLTALAGYVAVDAADKKKAEEALRNVLGLVDFIKQALGALK